MLISYIVYFVNATKHITSTPFGHVALSSEVPNRLIRICIIKLAQSLNLMVNYIKINIDLYNLKRFETIDTYVKSKPLK